MNPFDCLAPTLDLDGYHALEASAGTGKTFAIQHLVARLILQGVSLDDILIVTFTRAATRELKSRIRSNLETLFQNEPLYISALSPEKKIAAQLAAEEALALFDQAQIFTIHGFCQRMLYEFGFEAGIGLSLLSQEEENYRDLLIQEITDFFHTSLPPSSYSTKQLTALMRHCSYDKDKLVQKVLYFVEQEGEFPVLPDYEASRNQFYTLDLEIPPLEEALRLAPAFKDICNRAKVLKEEYQKQYQALLAKNFDDLLTTSSLFACFRSDNRTKRPFTEEELTPLYNLEEKLAPLIHAAIDPKHTLVRIARDARQKAREALLENEMFSPDDLLLQMKEALSNPVFRSKVHSRYKAVVIDEFQDTDTHQWAIFKTLFVDKPIQVFYIVGDPKQSIYGFRNADLNTYLQAKKAMHKTSHLTTNYRSEPNLLNSLNLLFSKQSHFPYMPVNANPMSRNSAFTDEKNPLHFFTVVVEKKTFAHVKSEYFFPFIAREIQALTERKEATFKDFAVLVKDRYQAMRLKSYLEKRNIPTASKSTKPLRETSAYTFMQSLLKALIDPKHVHQLLAHPIYQFTHHELKEVPHTEIIAFLHKQTLPFHKIIDNILHYHWKPGQILMELLVENGSLETYADFMQLVELLLQESSQTPEHLLEYLAHLPIEQAKYCRRPLSDLDTITIMTIHSSKGLEFPIVFALGLMNRYTSRQDFIRHQKKWLLFASGHTDCQAALQDQEAEKMRQLYVALTRAKKRLYIPVLNDLGKPPSLGSASPLELLLADLPPLEELLPSINATQTVLEPDDLEPLPTQTPSLHPPLIKKTNFTSHHIHSFSSLTKHLPPPSPETPENALPKGTATGLLLHSLLEKIVREKLTHPYQPLLIHSLIANTVQRTAFYPHLSTITNLINLAFHQPLSGFCLVDIPPRHLHPEIEFLYSQSPNTSLKGFADLIFFHKNAYYVLDWKTNLLTDYTQETLHQAMEQNEYFLQAKIYTEALRRYLTFKKDSHSIGGTYYLFLRGLPGGQGLYFLPNN